MASHEKTRGTATYLANSLAASDRLYLLDDVVSRLTSRLLPVIDLGLMDVDDSAEAKSAEPLNAEEFVQFLNEATPRELRNAGLDWQQGQALIAQRPHVDTEELSQTLGLGADFFDDLRIGAAGWKKGAEVSGLYLTADEVVRVLDLVHRASTVHMIEVVCLPQELAIRIEQTRPFGGIQALASLPGINFSIISALLSFVNDWLPRTRVQDVVLSRPETRDILLVVNLASLKQLETEAGLPHEALEHLREHRPISSIDELLAVPGIGRHVLARLLLLSRTWEPAPPAPPAPSALPQAPLGDNEP